MACFSHFETAPCGADGRIRTGDLILTKAMVGLLYSPLYALIGKMILYVSKK